MLPHPKYVYTYSQDAGRSKAHTSVRAQRLQVTLQLARREKERTSLKQMLSIKEKKIHSGPFPVPLSRYKVREKFNSGTASQNGIPLVLVHCKILVFYCLSWRGKAKKKKQNLILVIINIFSDKGVRGEMSVFTQQTPVDFVPQGNGSDWGAVMITWPVLSLPPTTSVFALCCVPSAPCRCTYSFIYSADADTVYPELVGKAITFLIK